MECEKLGSGAYSFIRARGKKEVAKEILDYPELNGIGSWREVMIWLFNQQLIKGSLRLIPYMNLEINKQPFRIVTGSGLGSNKVDPLVFVMPRAQMNGSQFLRRLEAEQCLAECRSRYAKRILVECLLDLKFLLDWGFIHLDVKLENILITLDKEKNISWAHLCDFSFIEPNLEAYRTTSECCFTFGLRPPEHLIKHKVSKNSDIWSLGVSIYELLTGHQFMPFKSTLECGGKKYKINNDKSAMIYLEECVKERRWTLNLIPAMKVLKYTKDELTDWFSILTKMIVFDPEERSSIDELLSYSFFDEYRDYINQQSEHEFKKYPALNYKELLLSADDNYKVEFDKINNELSINVSTDIKVRGLDLFIRYCQASNLKPKLSPDLEDYYRMSIYIYFKLVMPCGTNKYFNSVFTHNKNKSQYTDDYIYKIESNIVNTLQSIWYSISDTTKVYQELFD